MHDWVAPGVQKVLEGAGQKFILHWMPFPLTLHTFVPLQLFVWPALLGEETTKHELPKPEGFEGVEAEQEPQLPVLWQVWEPLPVTPQALAEDEHDWVLPTL